MDFEGNRLSGLEVPQDEVDSFPASDACAFDNHRTSSISVSR